MKESHLVHLAQVADEVWPLSRRPASNRLHLWALSQELGVKLPDLLVREPHTLSEWLPEARLKAQHLGVALTSDGGKYREAIRGLGPSTLISRIKALLGVPLGLDNPDIEIEGEFPSVGERALVFQGLTLLDGQCGTGKTLFIEKKARERPLPTVYVSLRRLLATSTGERMGAANYQKLQPHRCGPDYLLHNHLVIVVNSLFRFREAISGLLASGQPYRLVLDEYDSLRRHLYSGTVSRADYSLLGSLIRQAADVIAASATAKATDFEWLTQRVAPGLARLVIRTSRKPHAGVQLQVWPYRLSLLIRKLGESIEAHPDWAYFIPTSSRKEAQTVGQYLSQQFPHKKGLVFSSENSGDSRTQAAISEPRQAGLTWLITTTALDVGVNYVGSFDVVWGFYPQLTVSPETIFQQFLRERAAKEYHLMVNRLSLGQKIGGHFPPSVTERDGYFRAYSLANQEALIATSVEVGAQGLIQRIPHKEDEECYGEYLRVGTEDDLSKEVFPLWALFRRQGFELDFIPKTILADMDFSEERATLQSARKDLREEWHNSVREARDLTDSEAMTLKDKKVVECGDSLALLKHRYLKAAGGLVTYLPVVMEKPFLGEGAHILTLARALQSQSVTAYRDSQVVVTWEGVSPLSEAPAGVDFLAATTLVGVRYLTGPNRGKEPKLMPLYYLYEPVQSAVRRALMPKSRKALAALERDSSRSYEKQSGLGLKTRIVLSLLKVWEEAGFNPKTGRLIDIKAEMDAWAQSNQKGLAWLGLRWDWEARSEINKVTRKLLGVSTARDGGRFRISRAEWLVVEAIVQARLDKADF